MEWMFLAAAIVFEVGGTTLLKMSEGFTRWAFAASALAVYGVSFLFLSFALRTIDVGVAYAIWSGLGTVLVVIVGYLVFGEPMTALKLGFVAMIVAGVIGLHLTSSHA